MAVGKAAALPALDICVASAACREALEATVAKFTEAVEEVTPATIRRRIRKAKGFNLAPDLALSTSPIANGNGLAAAVDCSPKAKARK